MAQVANSPVEIKAEVEGDFAQLFLIFSVDNGVKWYEVEMKQNPPHYIVKLPDQPVGLKILYMFKAIGQDGEEFVENNQGQYYTYIVGVNAEIASKSSSESVSNERIESETEELKDNSKPNSTPIKESENEIPAFPEFDNAKILSAEKETVNPGESEEITEKIDESSPLSAASSEMVENAENLNSEVEATPKKMNEREI